MSMWRIYLYRVLVFVGLCCSLALITAQNSVTDPVEVTALRAIKRSLTDKDRNLRNWKNGDPCTSNWTGVMCFNTTMNDGYHHVRELHLLNLNLGGSLSPELGRLSYMKILDFMWNNISGSIPGEIGNISSLELLLLNGNQLTGSLPEEIGYIPNLDRIQLDQNQISGPIPKSFAHLNNTKHIHMNNNSISGQIPPELYALRSLVHLLLDNNNLSGYLPSELAEMPNLLILQLDNNQFDGSTIPATYSNMSRLLKLSLRNCSLQGPIPDLSMIPNLAYIDLSLNQLNGSIPHNKLSEEITTIDLSHNKLTGNIPTNFAGLPLLQRLSLSSNSLNGSVPAAIWQNRTLHMDEKLILDLQNNMLSNIEGSLNLPPNVTLRLQGNPMCSNANIVKFCGTEDEHVSDAKTSNISIVNHIQRRKISTIYCPPQACPPPYEYAPDSPEPCFCAAPLLIGYRLKSPGFWDFVPYKDQFEVYLTSGLKLELYQLYIDSSEWQEGPRLQMYLKIFPVYVDNSSHVFNRSEVLRIQGMFTQWTIPGNKVFGPFELLNFTLLDPYKDAIPVLSKSGISKGTLVGIIVGIIAGAVTLSAIVSLIILRMHLRKHHSISRKRQLSKISMKIVDVKSFSYDEMTKATSNFSSSAQVGRGGYGKVYKGIVGDGTVVAIKRAEVGSLQGEREFLTEIELLSRLHHRNLVSLIGYCDEESEQMLVYEFMPNGTLRDHISGKSKQPLSFATRLSIALGSAKGVLYLHTEADPPIFHRDIKASNILLDQNFNAKVADFGLSRLAPLPDSEGTIPAHVSTVVRGTPGYLDPEYFLTHKLTDKSDVYSMGVVFLELLTGMHPIYHGKNIVREVNSAYKSGIIFSIIDQRMGSYPSECVENFVNLALNCCQEDTNARPSMAQVVRQLESIFTMMPETEISITSSITTTDTESSVTVQSSSSSNPYLSSDVSGGELVSGAVPVITPR